MISNTVPGIAEGRGEVAVVSTPRLRMVDKADSVLLEATDGTESLSGATDVFGSIDEDLLCREVSVVSPPTKEMSVSVLEVVQASVFADIFRCINPDLGLLLLIQHQIKRFVQKCQERVRLGERTYLSEKENGNFFLFESDGKFLVADVRLNCNEDAGLVIRRFDFYHRWFGFDNHLPRVIVPRSALRPPLVQSTS